MNTCGTCKYLGAQIKQDDWDKDEEVGTGYFPCERIKHNKPLSHGGYGHEEADWTLIACVQDGSGYHAALCVKEDFGCVLWEPKE